MHKSWFVVAILATVVATAACGPTNNGVVKGPSSSDTPSATSSASATTKGGPSASVSTSSNGTPAAWDQYYPAQDTTYNLASASLKTAWASFQVTTIPGSHIFSQMPPLPKGVNYNTSVSASVYHEILQADERDAALTQWMELHDESALSPALIAPQWSQQQIAVAMGSNYPVHDPNCDIYPEGEDVFPMTPSVHTFLLHSEPIVSSKDDLAIVYLFNFGKGCAVTATENGKSVKLQSGSGASIDIAGGYLEDNPTLGPIVYEDAGGGCTQPGAPQQLCAAQFT